MKKQLQALINAVKHSTDTSQRLGKATQELAVQHSQSRRAELAKIKALDALDFEQLDSEDEETMQMLKQLAFETERNMAVGLQTQQIIHQSKTQCQCPTCTRKREVAAQLRN